MYLAPGLNLEFIPLPGCKNRVVFPEGVSRVNGYLGLSPESLGPGFEGLILEMQRDCTVECCFICAEKSSTLVHIYETKTFYS